MKIVFLDFDGVLNNLGEMAFGSGPPTFNRAAIERLNRIVHESKAKVVVSSSWRTNHSLEELRAILKDSGFQGDVIDCTPLHVTMELMQFIGVGVMRCQEIQAWIHEQSYAIESFVILDDIDLEPLAPYHVKTDVEVGLCDHHVDLALDILH